MDKILNYTELSSHKEFLPHGFVVSNILNSVNLPLQDPDPVLGDQKRLNLNT